MDNYEELEELYKMYEEGYHVYYSDGLDHYI